ncbi:MAG TPA: hypothetical protein VGL94_13975 [Ktedonobacteraceae bacterium]|jgi:hypothetical protein
MENIVVSLLSIFAYIVGLVILWKVTPRLLSLSFDEPMFVGIATLDILGACFAFGAIVVTLGLFDGSFEIKLIDLLLLVGIFGVSIRMASYCLRPRAKAFWVSQWLAGAYCLFLVGAAGYYTIQLFAVGK